MTKRGLAYLLLVGVVCAYSYYKKKNLTALQKLKEGNKRFASGKPIHPDETLKRIQALKKCQEPFAAIVSCSDSRVPAELIFDQGLGDIFSIRTAGNIIGDYELGSLEYAVEHLDCKLVVVLGHKDCGAVTAFVDAKGHYEHHDHIKNIIDYIENEYEIKELIKSNNLTLDNAIDANIAHGVTLLRSAEPILKELYTKNKIQIMGAIYDVETGKVTFKT